MSTHTWGGSTTQRPRTLTRTQLILSVYMTQPCNLLTHLKKKIGKF